MVLLKHQLHLLTDPRLPREQLLDAVRAAADNGVDWVHARDHQATARDLFKLTRAVVALCRPRGVRVAVNDRIDIALAAEADGAQLGARSLPIVDACRIAPRLAIGVSIHDVESARQAEAGGAEWVTFGHVYETSSHPGEQPRGLAELALVARAVQIPVIAIGGIGVNQIDDVLAAGAGGIAIISAILNAPDPGAATAELRRRLVQLR